MDDLKGLDDLKGRTVRGGFAKLCGQATNFFLRVTFIAVLARFLSPEDFGLIGMVTVVTGLSSILTNAWISAGSVQQAEIDDRQLSTLFWVYLAFGAILCMACVAAAPVLVAFYHEPRLFGVTVTLGLGCLFTAAGVQHFAILQRQLRYIALTVVETISLFASIAVGAGMAIAGFGYWALVAATVVAPACSTVGLWLATRWIPGLPRRIVGTRATVGFGGAITFNILVVYIAYNIDKLLVGRFWGADALGIYGRAYQLVTIPPENINSAIGGLAFSALSRLRDDPVRFRRYFLKGYSLIMSIAFPITVFCALYADDIVAIVLGPNWNEAAEIFQLLTPTVLVFSIINPFGWMLFARGLVARSTRIALVIAPLVIVAYVIGLPYGPKGVALAFSSAMLVWLVPHILWSVHGTPISARDLIAAVGRPFLSAALAAVVGYSAQRYSADMPHAVLRLALGGSAMFAAYLFILMFVLGQKDSYLELIRGLRPRALDSTS
jgi:O-antigen/teichoic acid export membrane protein